MLKYELKKLFCQRTVCILLAAIYAVFALSFLTSMLNEKKNTPPADDIDRLFELYITDKEAIESTVKERKALLDEYYYITLRLSPAEAEKIPRPEFENIYTNSDRFSDDDLLSILNERVDYCGHYAEKIQNVIREARTNLDEEVLVSELGYYGPYQRAVAETYEKVIARAPAVGFEHIRGWDALFLPGFMNTFLMLSVLLLGATCFSKEWESGFIGILRLSKHGRGRTAATKLLALFIQVTSVLLIYILTAVIIIACTVGFSSAFNYIQSIETFLYAPFALTMLEYLFVFIGMKFLSLLLFALATAFISQRFKSIELIYISGVALYGLSYIGALFPTDSIFHYLGFASVLFGSDAFSRLHLLNLMNIPVSYVIIVIVIYLVLILLMAFLTYRSHCRRSFGVLRRFSIALVIDKIRNKLQSLNAHKPKRSVKIRVHSHSLFYFEGYKQMVSSHLVLLLILLLGVQLQVSSDRYDFPESRTESIYLSYLENVHGEYTDAAGEFIEEENRFLTESMANFDWAEQAYRQGSISEEKFSEIQQNYYYSLFHWNAFQKLKAQHEYILTEKSEKGSDAWFIFTRGWNLFFTNGVSYPMLIFILLLTCGAFAGEYRGFNRAGSFAAILRTSRNGRKQTFFAKFLSVTIFSIMGSMLFTAADLCMFIRYFGLKDLDAPLVSVETFRNMESSLTIGQYLPLYVITVVLYSLLFACTICCISEFTHNSVAALSVSTIILFLPGILADMKFNGAVYADLLYGLNGQGLWLLSSEKDLMGNSLTSGIIIPAMIIAAVGTLIYISYRKYAK